MISQNLWKELRCVLLELNGHPAMWNLPIFLDAWNQSLSEPFTRASIPVTPEQRKKCFDGLLIILDRFTDLSIKYTISSEFYHVKIYCISLWNTMYGMLYIVEVIKHLMITGEDNLLHK